MPLVLSIATVDRTSVLIEPSLKVEQIAGAFTSTCTFDLVDEDKDITIYAKDAITLVDGATTFFAGTVATIDYINFGRDSRRIKVACQDYNSLCASVVIDGSGGHSPFEAVLDEVIIDTLFDEYLPAINSHNPGGGGFVDGGHLFVNISFVNMTMAQMLDRICSEADAEWYVDNELYLHYFIRDTGEASNLLAWGLSDDPGTDAARTNLVDNPSFEVNITDFWDENLWDTAERSATQEWIGDYSARYYEANFIVIAPTETFSDLFAVDANTAYTLSFYLYKAICTGTGTFEIEWYTAGDAFISRVTDTFDAGTHDWQRYNVSGTSPATAAKAIIYLFESTGVTNATELELFFDAVLFEKVAVLDDYFDGTSPFCTWAGAAHNSNSNFAGVTTYAYFENVVKKVDSTQLVNEIFVVGGFGIGLWYDDAVSVALYGTHQGLVVDNTLLDVDDMEDRGEAVLSKYANPLSIYSIKTQKDGARAGKNVAFKNEMMDADILTSFTIKKLSITWPQGFDSEIYSMDLGGVEDAALRASGGAWDIIIHDSIPNPGNVPLSSRGWTQAIGFSATDHDTVAWAGGSLVTADGYVFTIAGGNTDNPGAMAATTYVFLDVAVSQTVLQKTVNVANAVGSNRILVAVAENVAAGKLAIFQAFGGEGQGVLITADHIVANTITTNEIAVNTILAGNIAAGAIETDELDAGAVTAVKIAANTITADKLSIGDMIYNKSDGLLLLGPHCEINPIAWYSLQRQWVTLSGAFHQEAGPWGGTRGLIVELVTNNWITNPSFEIDVTTDWTDYSSGAAAGLRYRTTNRKRFGSGSLVVQKTGGAGGDRWGQYSDQCPNSVLNTYYTASVWVNVTDAGIAKLLMYKVAGVGAAQESRVDVTGPTPGWVKLTSVPFQANATGDAIRVYVWMEGAPTATGYFDGVQLELRNGATSYCDGSLGAGYVWNGVANESTSTRTVSQVNMDLHAPLISSQSALTFAAWVQMPYDNDAVWPNPGAQYIMDAFGAGTARIIIVYNRTDREFRFYITDAWVTNGSVQAFEAGDWIHLVLTVNYATDVYNLYVNGVLDANSTAAQAADVITDWTLGSRFDGTTQGGFTFGEFATFNRNLTVIEINQLFNLHRPLVDMAAAEAPGIYILNGKFRLASSTSGNRIEITADEIAGYSAGNVKQFYLDSADGIAYAGAGSVILDVNGITLDEGTGTPNKVKWDSSGDEVGHLVAYDTGAGGSYVRLRALDEGDPWVGARVIMDCYDGTASNPALTIRLDGVIRFTDSLEFEVIDETFGDQLKITGGNFTIRLGDAIGVKNVLILDSLGVTKAWITSDGDASFDNIQTDAENIPWKFGTSAAGVAGYAASHKIYVEVGGNWFTVVADSGIV